MSKQNSFIIKMQSMFTANYKNTVSLDGIF